MFNYWINMLTKNIIILKIKSMEELSAENLENLKD